MSHISSEKVTKFFFFLVRLPSFFFFLSRGLPGYFVVTIPTREAVVRTISAGSSHTKRTLRAPLALHTRTGRSTPLQPDDVVSRLPTPHHRQTVCLHPHRMNTQSVFYYHCEITLITLFSKKKPNFVEMT